MERIKFENAMAKDDLSLGKGVKRECIMTYRRCVVKVRLFGKNMWKRHDVYVLSYVAQRSGLEKVV